MNVFGVALPWIFPVQRRQLQFTMDYYCSRQLITHVWHSWSAVNSSWISVVLLWRYLDTAMISLSQWGIIKTLLYRTLLIGPLFSLLRKKFWSSLMSGRSVVIKRSSIPSQHGECSSSALCLLSSGCNATRRDSIHSQWGLNLPVTECIAVWVVMSECLCGQQLMYVVARVGIDFLSVWSLLPQYL